MNKIFRFLILISIALSLVYYSVPYIDSNWLSKEELDFVSYNGAFAKIQISSFIGHISFVFWLICSIGMFFYINAARNFFTALVLISLLITPFIGFVSMSPFDATILAALNIIDGALIAIAHFTSVNKNFKNRQTRNVQMTSDTPPPIT